MYEHERPAGHSFHLMAKPAGPACNISCRYCFYSEKKVFFHNNDLLRMSDEVLETYVREYIKAQPGQYVVFDWQGGEPTLMGTDFFNRALDLQKKYSNGKRITNTLQTNGTLIDRSWCSFLAKNGFLAGLSLDGPEYIHNANRVYEDGSPTYQVVMNSLKMMLEHGVEVNVLASVSRTSSYHPLEVYRFFRESDVRFIQFIPIVERKADYSDINYGLSLAAPPSLLSVLTREEPAAVKKHTMTDWSVEPEKFGEFLSVIFDEWIKNDVGRIFVMNFEWALGAWAGMAPGVCYTAPICGTNMILEHNGDVYSCDHFMYPEFRLGNILEDELKLIVESDQQMKFGRFKENSLPEYCRKCGFLFACNGGCPKHRFINSPDGESGLNYLCAGFKKFYNHVNPFMLKMLELIRNGIPVSEIIDNN